MWLMFGVFLALVAMYFAALQYREEALLWKFLNQNQLHADRRLSKGVAVAVAQSVREGFNTDRKTFRCIGQRKRPFLREDAYTLLRCKEGVCGEGTRVIVALLLKLGFDATRLALYNKQLAKAHTLVSVIIGDREVLINSINSASWITEFLAANDISVNDFALPHVLSSDNMASPKRASSSYDESLGKFAWLFRMYSYEAIPLAKLISSVCPGIMLFNCARPSRIVSTLAEKPNTLRGLLAALGAIACSLPAVW